MPLRSFGWLRPDLCSEGFHSAKLEYPKDSGRKVWFAKHLLSLVDREPEALLLIDDWAVWPSCQHEPLFTRFREALGENRPLIEAPGHLIESTDDENAQSVVVTALLFMWDCYGISSSGRDAFFFSHDEYCIFVSRDIEVLNHVVSELQGD